MRRFTTILSLLLAAGLALLTFVPSAWAELTARANHDRVDIHLNYHGSTVSVSGSYDPGTDLILTISNAGTNEHLMLKDKIGGFIWMNKDKLSFEGVPEVYLQRSTKAPSDLLDMAQLRANGIGYEAIKANAEVDPVADPEKKATLMEHFVSYKEAKNLYERSVGDIELKSDGDQPTYFTEFDWPYQVPPGEYKVMAYEVKDGQLVAAAESGVTVEEAGVVKILADMATNNSAVYGIAAIAVALAAGFGVGMIFKKGGGAH